MGEIEKEYKYNPKPEFKERMKKLLLKEEDLNKFWEICHTEAIDSIRVNTLKISPEELKKRLIEKGWKIETPFENFPEIIIIKKETNLKPGEIGKSLEHLLGYYYVQDISSMMSPIALNPSEEDFVLDLCASPGSKTTQIAAIMKNKGTIIANDVSIDRISILNANLERCGVSNTIVTRCDGITFCKRAEKEKIFFDKILVDAPCSGEGTLRKSPRTMEIWNLKVIKNMSNFQKKLCASAIKILKEGGTLVYSTCTLSPEENEEVVDFLLRNFDIEIEEINIPMKSRDGIVEWEGKKFDERVRLCRRIYPQDNDSDGFFLAKIKKQAKIIKN
ncbi:MAG: RsmB/NOP family class I SAM-dependent RNA methyltransferase [Candidatus Pacearchaeota archaeon]